MGNRTIDVNLGEGQGIVRFEAITRGEADVSHRGEAFAPQDFDAVMRSITGFAERLHESLAQLKPQRAAVEFGVSIGAESGQLTALIVKGTGSANLTVTLEWDLERKPGEQASLPVVDSDNGDGNDNA